MGECRLHLTCAAPLAPDDCQILPSCVKDIDSVVPLCTSACDTMLAGRPVRPLSSIACTSCATTYQFQIRKQGFASCSSMHKKINARSFSGYCAAFARTQTTWYDSSSVLPPQQPRWHACRRVSAAAPAQQRQRLCEAQYEAIAARSPYKARRSPPP